MGILIIYDFLQLKKDIQRYSGGARMVSLEALRKEGIDSNTQRSCFVTAWVQATQATAVLLLHGASENRENNKLWKD